MEDFIWRRVLQPHKQEKHIELDFFSDVPHISNFLLIYEFDNECINFISKKEKSIYTNLANARLY